MIHRLQTVPKVVHAGLARSSPKCASHGLATGYLQNNDIHSQCCPTDRRPTGHYFQLCEDSLPISLSASISDPTPHLEINPRSFYNISEFAPGTPRTHLPGSSPYWEVCWADDPGVPVLHWLSLPRRRQERGARHLFFRSPD